MSVTEQEILDLIDENTGFTVPELSDKTGATEREVQMALETLMDRGLITSTPEWTYRRSRRTETEQSSGDTERRVRCSCGFQTDWFDAEDANELADNHGARCDGEIEYQEREKDGRNYSDGPSLPPNPCANCGADNVPGQVMCAVCGGLVSDV